MLLLALVDLPIEAAFKAYLRYPGSKEKNFLCLPLLSLLHLIK